MKSCLAAVGLMMEASRTYGSTWSTESSILLPPSRRVYVFRTIIAIASRDEFGALKSRGQ
jgi:hypothetical protein